MKGFILGLLTAMVLGACSMAGRRIDFDKLPSRSSEYLTYQRCLDGDLDNVCNYRCTKFDRKNKCKKQKTTKLAIKEALNSGYLVISKAYYFQLLKK